MPPSPPPSPSPLSLSLAARVERERGEGDGGRIIRGGLTKGSFARTSGGGSFARTSGGSFARTSGGDREKILHKKKKIFKKITFFYAPQERFFFLSLYFKK